MSTKALKVPDTGTPAFSPTRFTSHAHGSTTCFASVCQSLPSHTCTTSLPIAEKSAPYRPTVRCNARSSRAFRVRLTIGFRWSWLHLRKALRKVRSVCELLSRWLLRPSVMCNKQTLHLAPGLFGYLPSIDARNRPIFSPHQTKPPPGQNTDHIQSDRHASTLLSNNPFRDRAVSSNLSQSFTKSNVPDQANQRFSSTNPFLDSSDLVAPTPAPAPEMAATGRQSSSKPAMTETAIELFVSLPSHALPANFMEHQTP